MEFPKLVYEYSVSVKGVGDGTGGEQRRGSASRKAVNGSGVQEAGNPPGTKTS